ncbi:MAG: sugar ABC transporter permease [Candidatus Lambdaproteobacteria bacterium]|nr:sugar ABC transporter permease [Candidatus Lambdaproteobacteria bacterium]
MTALASHAAAPTGARSRLRRLADSERFLAWALLAPAVVFIVALVGFPFVLALLYSVTNVTVGTQSASFVGLAKFRQAMESPAFWGAVRNTFLFTLVSQALVIVLAGTLARLLMMEFRGKWFVRLLILLPWVAPISLGSIGWLWIFDSIYSVINWTLRHIGIFGPETWPIWLGQPTLAMASIITVHVWRMLPLAAIIMLAGFSGIPKDIHDAAAIDGAGFWRRELQIILPLVLPIVLVAVLFGIVFTATDMIVIFIITRGGPFDSTQVLASLAYYTGIDGGDLAEGAAISLFLFPLLVAIAYLMLRLARRTEVT